MKPIDSLNQELLSCKIQADLISKWHSLISELSSFESAVIAYSGGVDSSFLAFAAHQVLGERMIAVTIQSILEPLDAHDSAVKFAIQHGFRHTVIQHDPLQDPVFRSNPIDRCYYCKRAMLAEIWNYGREWRYQVVLEGQNHDDLQEYRPGRVAVSETGTASPLANNRLTKAEIRQLAKAFELSIWNKPSTPCLATRIPYGTPITAMAIDRIARAERYLHERGFSVVRVRDFQDAARIEIEPEQIQTLTEFRSEFLELMQKIGYKHVDLDLQGYRSGSMDEGLAK